MRTYKHEARASPEPEVNRIMLTTNNSDLTHTGPVTMDLLKELEQTDSGIVQTLLAQL